MLGGKDFERYGKRKAISTTAFAEIDNPLSADADTAQKGPLRDPIELLAIEYRVVIGQQALLDAAGILWGIVQRMFLIWGGTTLTGASPLWLGRSGSVAQCIPETSCVDRILDT